MERGRRGRLGTPACCAFTSWCEWRLNSKSILPGVWLEDPGQGGLEMWHVTCSDSGFVGKRLMYPPILAFK